MNNIAKIQKQLEVQGLDAVLITDEKNQRYATGFPITDGAVFVSRDRAWLITDSRYIEAATAAVAGSGITVVLYTKEHGLTDCLREAIRESGAEKLAAEDRKLSYSEYLAYEKDLGRELLGAGDMFITLRAVKSGEELDSMREAQRISEKALEAVLHTIKPGMTEKQVAAELVYHMLLNGSEANSFDPIVVTGSKTSLPHGVPGDRVIQAGDFLTMDFGCLKNGYCSDMTRTVAVGYATEEMRSVYDVVLRAQLAGIDAARAGIQGKVIDAAARKVITDAGYGEYFGHGFGHSLGLDIHERPNANPAGEAIMPEGSVCSAEPGIYIPGRFGVRIEDVMILRENGAEVITRSPKELIIL
ncbi:MAG: Xaa-Pro peptidase family protein [Candidatus Limivicinus sp.]|nr:Xaa-Pro peptidase family protein [Candidatus Limivicinus sp.]